jgi:hypothetical protein
VGSGAAGSDGRGGKKGIHSTVKQNDSYDGAVKDSHVVLSLNLSIKYMLFTTQFARPRKKRVAHNNLDDDDKKKNHTFAWWKLKLIGDVSTLSLSLNAYLSFAR